MEMTLNSLGRKVPLELPGAGSFAPYISPFAMLGRRGELPESGAKKARCRNQIMCLLSFSRIIS